MNDECGIYIETIGASRSCDKIAIFQLHRIWGSTKFQLTIFMEDLDRFCN